VLDAKRDLTFSPTTASQIALLSDADQAGYRIGLECIRSLKLRREVFVNSNEL
jgi:hypothetical protein